MGVMYMNGIFVSKDLTEAAKLFQRGADAGFSEAMGNLGIHFWPTFWGFMAAATEGIGGMLLILGAFYRPTCLLLSFTMTVATVSLAPGAWALDAFNKGYSRPLEMAVVFFGLAFIGPGRFSIDKD